MAVIELTPVQRRVLQRGATGRAIWLSDDAGTHTAERIALGELERAGLVKVDDRPKPPGPPTMPSLVLTAAGAAALAEHKE